jgi:hypothetical protein
MGALEPPQSQGTNRIIRDHEFRSVLPYPVATAFHQYLSGTGCWTASIRRMCRRVWWEHRFAVVYDKVCVIVV